MTKQQEAARALKEAHEEQDKSHELTAQIDRELTEMIDKAGEGLHEKKTQTA